MKKKWEKEKITEKEKSVQITVKRISKIINLEVLHGPENY
jgi:hypothetical protein